MRQPLDENLQPTLLRFDAMKLLWIPMLALMGTAAHATDLDDGALRYVQCAAFGWVLHLEVTPLKQPEVAGRLYTHALLYALFGTPRDKVRDALSREVAETRAALNGSSDEKRNLTRARFACALAVPLQIEAPVVEHASLPDSQPGTTTAFDLLADFGLPSEELYREDRSFCYTYRVAKAPAVFCFDAQGMLRTRPER